MVLASTAVALTVYARHPEAHADKYRYIQEGVFQRLEAFAAPGKRQDALVNTLEAYHRNPAKYLLLVTPQATRMVCTALADVVENAVPLFDPGHVGQFVAYLGGLCSGRKEEDYLEACAQVARFQSAATALCSTQQGS